MKTTVLLYDQFNWEYQNERSKRGFADVLIESCREKAGITANLVASWDYFMAFDLGDVDLLEHENLLSSVFALSDRAYLTNSQLEGGFIALNETEMYANYQEKLEAARRRIQKIVSPSGITHRVEHQAAKRLVDSHGFKYLGKE